MLNSAMQASKVRALALAAILLMGSSALFAQTDPSSIPSSSPGSNPAGPGSSPTQQSPGVKNQNGSVFAQDASMNGAGGPDTAALRDKMFLREVGEGVVAEYQLGQLAAQKAGSDDVKKFGQKLVDDHMMLTDLIRPIAVDTGVEIPKKMSKADQAEYKKLQNLSGPTFDQEYITYEVLEHRRNLRDFRLETAATTDPALRDAAVSGAKVIGMHTRMAVEIARTNGITLPPRPTRP